MLHDLLQWLQDVPGAVDGDPSTSWSQILAGSLHLWALIEGTHVLSLMLFAGTILMVDLRMLGLVFKDVPYSTLNNKILPYTIAGFALVMGFALVWHIWWLAVLSFAAMIVGAIVHTFNYKRDFDIPAATVTAVEEARTRQLAAGA